MRADVRIVAATSADPAARVAAGHFRADLFYRLNVLTIHAPPLRDRLSDIECGLNAGCRTVLLTHDKSSRRATPDPEDEVARVKAHYVTSTLTDAANWIVSVSHVFPVPKTHELL